MIQIFSGLIYSPSSISRGVWLTHDSLHAETNVIKHKRICLGETKLTSENFQHGTFILKDLEHQQPDYPLISLSEACRHETIDTGILERQVRTPLEMSLSEQEKGQKGS